MPTEVRRITFRRDELGEALKADAALGDLALGEAVLSFVKGDGGKDRLQVAAGPAADAQAVRLDAEAVGAALVRYCLDRGIPIPQNATRSLAINKGNLALFIHLDEEVDETTVQLPDYYSYDFYG